MKPDSAADGVAVITRVPAPTPTPLNVVLVAEESAGARVVRLAAANPSVSVDVVLTSPHGGAGTGGVWSAAERAGLSVQPAERVKHPALVEELRERNIDLILNVHSLYLLPGALVKLPRLGAYNLHPGPLPEMAGLDVPSWAIYREHQDHGVTLHRMTAGIDEGAIAFEDRFPIDAGATGLSLSVECARRGLALVERLLDTAVRGEPIPARSQDTTRRKYYRREAPNWGAIDFTRSAAAVSAHVRAANYRPFRSPWGHPRARSGSAVVELVSAPVAGGQPPSAPPGTVSIQGQEVLVACGTGSVVLETILVAGAVALARSALQDGEVLTPHRATSLDA